MTPADADGTVEFADRAVYLPDADALVLADVHLGRGEASMVDAPIDAAERVVERIAELLDRFDPATVAIAGDLLHSFSWIPRGVRLAIEGTEAAIDGAGAELVCTPGNHDAMLADVFDGETAPARRLADGETVVCHGHERPQLDGSRYVIGHDHPALAVEGRKHPCFLYGPGAYEDGDGAADVLVLPAFSRLARGTTVNARRGRDFQSPLVTDADAFHPVIRDVDGEETLWFPPLGECRRVL
ncbi:metallophosphoesterase [Halovivax sp.]|uniref:metallophosphoesterase n=1 Tax=Halovivax sp. TaxID=1935978 RepID=UPI0025C2B3C2|nr:metallophosphoesterase [Halovivax sp.]